MTRFFTARTACPAWPGHRLAHLVVALLLAALPAAAETPEDPRALVGQPVLALAAHPAVTLTLRQASGGRQAVLARLARAPGPPLRLSEDGRFIYGWGCAPATGCDVDGFFLAYDAEGERLYAVLFADGESLLWIPPRASRWPADLAGPVRAFSPAIAARKRFLPPEAEGR